MSVPPARLAAAADPGADVYNSYHLVTQLSGLYAQAAASDHHVEGRAAWGELADQCIDDLGDLYALWSEVVRSPPSAPLDAGLHTALRATCLRAAVAVRTLTMWVPFQRWARLLLLLERRWSKLAARLQATMPAHAARVGKLRQHAESRAQRVFGLHEIYAKERDRLDAAHATGAALIASGGGLP